MTQHDLIDLRCWTLIKISFQLGAFCVVGTPHVCWTVSEFISKHAADQKS